MRAVAPRASEGGKGGSDYSSAMIASHCAGVTGMTDSRVPRISSGRLLRWDSYRVSSIPGSGGEMSALYSQNPAAGTAARKNRPASPVSGAALGARMTRFRFSQQMDRK